MMRREFITLSGGTAAWSLVARALSGNAGRTSPADLDRFMYRKGRP
jgi:hypothetical protein